MATALPGPEALLRRQKAILWAINGGAAASLAISAAIWFAWIFRLRSIELIAPGIFAFKINSAIGFCAASAAILLLARGLSRPAIAAASVSILIGMLTIAEYLGLGSFSIDEILGTDWSANAALPGRVPLNTAVILTLTGAGILLCACARMRWRDMAIRSLALLIIAVAMESLAGHMAGSSFAVAWGVHQPMSVPSTISASALGIALLAFSWPVAGPSVSRIPLWIPALICFAAVLFEAYTPLDVNAAICFLPLVLTALWFRNGNVALAFAAISTVLVIFGLFASPPGAIAFETAIFNRSLAITVLWVVAILIRFQVPAREKLIEQSALIALANAELTASLEERGILLREVYHRVKNNMQMVDSLVVLQARRFSDDAVKQSFLSVSARIYALGLVHHQLMGSKDLRTFDLGPFLTELTTHLMEGASTRDVRIEVNAEAMQVGLDLAIPMGLLLTELITNSLKHAFGERAGCIRVDIRSSEDGMVVLCVDDDGIGQTVARERPESARAGMGSTIIAALVRQLRGKMTVKSDQGTSTCIEFLPVVQS